MQALSTKSVVRILGIALVLLIAAPAVFAQDGDAPDRAVGRPLPASIATARLDSPRSAEGVEPFNKVDSELLEAQGPQQVIVRLAEDAVAEVAAGGADASAQQSQLSEVLDQQNGVINRALELDGNAQLLGTAQRASNVVMLQMDAASLQELAADQAVVAINPVHSYHLVLDETVPYIGGTAVHDLGYTGDGIQVAVLDTGIDYTHIAFGGPGTLEAYAAAHDAPTTTDGLFPTARVVGGFDFIGEDWAGGADPLVPDPDPIDFQGHGTHVADIIGGALGVAPDSDLWALRVCSAISTACSGVALIQAMDFAVDPNADGDTSDHVDVVNMSLGSDYGQAFDDDLSLAVNNATAVGVLSVAASGNAGDRPYVSGTPGAAFTALSVAQTEVPSATQPFMAIVSPASIAGDYIAVFQEWSAELTTIVEQPVQYGDGAGGNLDGCAAFPAGSLTGFIVLVDRGTCAFSIKITNIAAGGGSIGVIAQNTAEPPFGGAFGGGTPDVPGYMIFQSDGQLIKDAIAGGETVTARFDPANAVPLIGTVTATSSRGPAMLTNIIKPEIGAPGASVSAEVGTGTGTTAFGGTSGATPMVSGSAALLMQAYPDRHPLEIKAVLMNTAETEIFNIGEALGGGLAPITRIGGGEVRVDRAVTSPTAAWGANTHNAALSFGFHDVTDRRVTLKRLVEVHNYSNQNILYRVTPTFRFEDDNDGAVKVKAPKFVWVPKNGKATFWVTVTIDGRKLQQWGLDSGFNGANADLLTDLEYDGYIWLDDFFSSVDDNSPLHLAWQVLPRQSGNVSANSTRVEIGEVVDPDFGVPTGSTQLRNKGVGPAYVDAYSLLATSPDLPEGAMGANAPIIDLRYVGVATFPVEAGFCSDVESFVMSFAVNTWERQTHANAPALFFFDLDVDQDGDFEYEVFNYDLSLSSSLDTGQNVTWVADLDTGLASAFFYTNHGTNSGNTVLTFCAEQIGMTTADYFDPMDVSAGAVDLYFTGFVTDTVPLFTISPLGERYLGFIDDFGFGDIPANHKRELRVLDFGPVDTNPGELGLLLLLDQPRDTVRSGAPAHNEALAIPVIGSPAYDIAVTEESAATEEATSTEESAPNEESAPTEEVPPADDGG